MRTDESFTGVAAVAGYGARKGGVGGKGSADAAGRRIGAELGLGEYLGADDRSKSRMHERIAAGVLLVIMPWYAAVITGIRFLLSPGWDPAAGRLSGTVIFVIGLGIGTPLMAMLVRKREWLWLYSYEGGFAQVTGRRRMSVVRWAELASMSVSVVQGYEDEYVAGCVLRDHAGNAVTVGVGLIGRAEQILTGRLVGPLTARLDAGLPVTVGCLTVDQSGIRCHGGQARNNWTVSWQQVHGIETRLHGQRVTVKTGHRGGKHAALDNQPNGFLASYALEHAARRAGVPFFAE